MKKSLFTSLVVLCVISCTNRDYTISGSIENPKLDGKAIFIKERINREWITIDSIIIKNKLFTFKGKVDTAKIAYLVYEFPTGKSIRQAFVLENGKISASIDTAGFIKFSGTSKNELLQTYQNQKQELNLRDESYYTKNKPHAITPEQIAEFDKQMEKLSKEEQTIDIKFSTENVNSLVGTHIFLNSFYGMNLSEKEAIINLMNAETKKIKRIQEIIADMKVEKKVAVGQVFTDIKMSSINGETVALSDLVGKTDYVLVDFWASWCGPCMQFLPDLQVFYHKYNPSQLQIFGVSLDDDKNAWINAVKSHNITWSLVSDLKGWKCEGSRAYAINSIPATVLIDKSGKIVGRNLTISEMEKYLNQKVDKK